MLFQQAPAETTGYMIFGYTIIFGSLLVYLVSFFVRRRNLEQDLDALKELEQE